MKRIKMLSIVFMFLLCVTGLCVGVYSASFISVGISGELNIIPAPDGFPVSVQTYVDKTLQKDYGTTKNNRMVYSGEIKGSQFTSTQPLLLSIKLTNQSDTELGAYFLDTTIAEEEAFDENGLVTANGVKVKHEYTSVNVYLASYSYMAKSKASNDYDSVDMTMVFVPKEELASTATISYSFSIYVEEYVSNMDAEDLTIGGSWLEQGEYISCVKTMPANLIKIDSNVTALEASSFSPYSPAEGDVIIPASWNENYPNYIVLPSSITEVPDSCFSNARELYGMFIPKSITNVWGSAFQNVAISCYVFPNNIKTYGNGLFYSSGKYVFFGGETTQIGYNPFFNSRSIEYIKIEKGTSNITFNAILPVISGKTWYLNGVALANHTALSISSATDNIYICK